MKATTHRAKNSYHTALIFKTQFNLLSSLEKKSIPKSTRYDWKNRDLDSIIGYDSDDPTFKNLDLYKKALECETLKKALKALFSVYFFYNSLTENIKGKRKIWNLRKKEIVSIIQKIAPNIGLKRACRFMNISTQRFYKWKNEVFCNSSAFGICKKTHPKQLTIQEQYIISKYIKNNEFNLWPLRSIFYKILNDGYAFFSLATFYKYAKVFNPTREVFRKIKRKIGIRTSAPLLLLHMDTTILRVQDGSKVYIHFIMDNFSRTILGWKASLEWNSKYTVSNLTEVCEKYDLFQKHIQLLCDDGSENQGAVDVFLKRPGLFIQKLIAQVDILFSNSMSEAVNKIMKYQFLFPKNLSSIQEVIQTLETAVPLYNSRPSGVLFGFSPEQVLNGAIPDPRRFSKQIKSAAEKRPNINKSESCFLC
ncbi:DDE-type integrase/transposase/recombinase [Leptospira santarosai]|uniref:Integrase core domain protein n=1 Tax=Leptospira santarosai serovar Arenal str. MAVJ 401 TaxID=1049976 RepID=M6JPC0_9LEPT|nr:DDE-type integrase/transposase/recombinase [Leptospira santarosai]EMN23566.1 integrase core domain protein [Leptospira santarosai serovar Arenal str. MAVJ 401]MDI7208878.1 DDE-type integrase/transposase/recombinase [Leptospira santarosai]MDI7230455.1 DDE-type integrase/transposase/recombinase [Leptospira santarosai]